VWCVYVCVCVCVYLLWHLFQVMCVCVYEVVNHNIRLRDVYTCITVCTVTGGLFVALRVSIYILTYASQCMYVCMCVLCYMRVT